jgi:hypothetical protein
MQAVLLQTLDQAEVEVGSRKEVRALTVELVLQEPS